MKVAHVAPLAACALALAGCAANGFMRPESPRFEPPLRGNAQVVFVRPGRTGTDCMPVIIDEGGTLLGQALRGSYFKIAVAPGHHRFFMASPTGDQVDGQRVDVLEAELVEGKTYFVEVAVKASCGADLVAIKAGLNNLPHLDTWMATSEPTVANPARRQAQSAAWGEKVREWMQLADQRPATRVENERAWGVLGADDGR